MRKLVAISLCVLFLLNLTACYDADEIDDNAYVAAIGIDRGVSNKWRLTIQFPTMKSGGGGGAGGGEGGGEEYMFVTVDAPSFFDGLNMLNASLPRTINLMHTHVILFSEDVAKAGLISEFIAPIIRYRQIRWSANVFVVKGTAMDFIKENKPTIGNTVTKFWQLLIAGTDNTGYYPHVTLEEFYLGLKTPNHQASAAIAAVNEAKSFLDKGNPYGTEFKSGGAYIAGEIPRSGENKIELFGTALFDGDRMVGELNGDETRYMLMVRGTFKRGFFVMQDPIKPDVIVPLDITSQKVPIIKVSFVETKPKIEITILLEADILAVQSGINYEQPDMKRILEQKFDDEISRGIANMIAKCQSVNSDVLGLGDYAIRKFLTIEDWENYNWNKRFRDADVTIRVETTIRRTGTQIKSAPIESSGSD